MSISPSSPLQFKNSASLRRAFLYPWVEDHISVAPGKKWSFDGHAYLKEIYTVQHPHIVFEKASQMCVSTFAISESIFLCDTKGLSGIYFFPTKTDVTDFSKGRVTPIIEASEYLNRLVSEMDAVGLKKVGNAHLYFRGMKSNVGRKSVPADFIVFDELDEATPEEKEWCEERLAHSDYKWIRELSNPSIPDYGIDTSFQKSDQRYWNLKCPHCRSGGFPTLNVLEEEFPKCLRRLPIGRVILACKNCGGELDTQDGIWVAKYPGRDIRGYHITQLYSTRASLGRILEKYEQARNLQVFYNSVLGIPYVDAKNRLSWQQVEACCSDYDMPYPARGCAMGVDQGNRLHCHIIERAENEKIKTVLLATLADGDDPEFKQLDPLMTDYDIGCCVIDGMPNTHSARSFAKRWPGRVYLNHSVESHKGDPVFDRDAAQVKTNKTLVLDAAHQKVTMGELMLPRQDYRDVREFIQHAHNTVKREEENEMTGEKKWVYLRTGDDHYWRAFGYALTASLHGAGIGTFQDIIDAFGDFMFDNSARELAM